MILLSEKPLYKPNGNWGTRKHFNKNSVGMSKVYGLSLRDLFYPQITQIIADICCKAAKSIALSFRAGVNKI